MLGPRLFASLASRFSREPALEFDATRARQLALFPEARIVSRESMIARLLETYYSNGSPNLLVPEAGVPSAFSYVPYYRGVTSVLVFNFFRFNYGIRDPVLYRLSILCGREVVWCRQYLLASDAVLKIEDPSFEVKGLPTHGNILLEAFHPRISTPGRQLRYFVIYRDQTSGSIAGVHSMVFAPEGLMPLAKPSYRGYGVGNVRHFYHSPTSSHSLLNSDSASSGIVRLSSNSRIVIPGYMTLESTGNAPNAIWHDGPTPHFTPLSVEKRVVGPSYTAFFVPDFVCHAPLMFVSGSQIGFSARRLVIHVFGTDNGRIASRSVELHEDPTSVDLGELFSERGIEGPASVVVEFDRDIGEFAEMPVCYLHLYYRSPSGWSDQVHSHNTVGYAEDPFRTTRAYRCRKFAPYLADSSLDFFYSLVNIGPKLRPVHDTAVRVRVFSDSGEEHVSRVPLSPSGITNLCAKHIFGSARVTVHKAAVVQFEHDSTNFNGAWYACDRKSGNLAVDHLTGA